MQQVDLKDKIKAYIIAAYQWHEENEGPLDEGSGLQMVELEEQILMAFGLPCMAFQYSDILQQEGFSIEDIDLRVESLLKRLTDEAERFLLAPIEKDTTVLQSARLVLQDAVEVLPMIGIETTLYNCFLYYDAFLKGLCNEEQLIQYFKETEQNTVPHCYEALDTLKLKDLPFIIEYQAYLKYRECKHKWNEDTNNNDLAEYVNLPAILILHRLIVKCINVKDENTCLMEVLLPLKNTFIELSIWCTASLMRIIMLHAKYYSLAIPPLYLTNPQFVEEGDISIILKQAISTNIEVLNLEMELERLYDEFEDINDPFAYVITHLQANEGVQLLL